jgi:hypothetical protein
MAILLGILVCMFTIPAWRPVFRRSELPGRLLAMLIALTAGAVLQLVFLFCVSYEFLTLDYSIRFASAGVPFAAIAFVLALTDVSSPVARGGIVSAVLEIVMWGFFATLH